MYIARRTGAGRGDLEIAGATTTSLTSTDLLGREIVFELSPDLKIPSGVALELQGGKHRLRRSTAEIHIQLQLAAALMLPSPRRVNDKGSGLPLLSTKAYVIERIHLDFINHLSSNEAYVVPGTIELKNLDNEQSLPAGQRLVALRRIWASSAQLPDSLRTLVRQHEGLVSAGRPIGRSCERVVAAIQREANRLLPGRASGSDPLPILEELLNLDTLEVDSAVEEVQTGELDLGAIAVVPQRIKRDIINRRGQWSFRQGLLAAYGSQCQVTLYTGEPALEAAHIYPYSEGGDYTNDLRNGLLLRADIHTLFDLGLLRVVPESLAVRIMGPLTNTSYATLEGRTLQASTTLRPSREALERKWAQS